MDTVELIAARLRAALPPEYQTQIEPLAQILVRILSLAPSAAGAVWDLNSPAIKALLMELPEHPASVISGALYLALYGGSLGSLQIRRGASGEGELEIAWAPPVPAAEPLDW